MKRFIYSFLMLVLLVNCAKRPTYNDPIPLYDQFEIESLIVNEKRVINVWTPPTYKESSERFPVLYMPDGGINEDFPHIANTLSQLILTNQIPPYILVGIENTVRGRDLTGASKVVEHEKYGIPMTDGAKNFRAFITDELMPEINNRYRTANKKGIIGESLAGLFVIETLLLSPAAFDFYIAIDPSLWWNNNTLADNVEEHLANFPDKVAKLWFAGSDAADISKYTVQLSKRLSEINSPYLKWFYSDEPKEKHHTIFRATKEKALIWSMND